MFCHGFSRESPESSKFPDEPPRKPEKTTAFRRLQELDPGIPCFRARTRIPLLERSKEVFCHGFSQKSSDSLNSPDEPLRKPEKTTALQRPQELNPGIPWFHARIRNSLLERSKELFCHGFSQKSPESSDFPDEPLRKPEKTTAFPRPQELNP